MRAGVLCCAILLALQVATAHEKDVFEDPFHNVFKCEGRSELGVGEGELQRCENIDLTFHCAPTDMIEYVDKFKSGNKYMLHLRNATHWGQLAMGYNDHTLYVWDPMAKSTKYIRWVFQRTGEQKCCEEAMDSTGGPTESAKCEDQCMWDKAIPVEQYRDEKPTPEFALKMRYQLYEHGKARAKVGLQSTLQVPRMGEFSEVPGRLDHIVTPDVANILAKIRKKDYVRSKYVEGAKVIKGFTSSPNRDTLSSWAPSFPRLAVLSRSRTEASLKAHMNRLLRGQGGDYRTWVENDEGEAMLMRNLLSFKLNMRSNKQLISRRSLSMVQVPRFQAYRDAVLSPSNYGYCEGLQKMDMSFSDLVDRCNKDDNCEWAWCHMQCAHKHREELFNNDCTCDGVDTIEVGMRLKYCDQLEGCYYDAGLKDCEAETKIEDQPIDYAEKDDFLSRLRERQYAKVGMFDQTGFINAKGPGIIPWHPHRLLGVLRDNSDDEDKEDVPIAPATHADTASAVHSPGKPPASPSSGVRPSSEAKPSSSLITSHTDDDIMRSTHANRLLNIVDDARSWMNDDDLKKLHAIREKAGVDHLQQKAKAALENNHMEQMRKDERSTKSGGGDDEPDPDGETTNDGGEKGKEREPASVKDDQSDDGEDHQWDDDGTGRRPMPAPKPSKDDDRDDNVKLQTMSMAEFLHKKEVPRPALMDLHEQSHSDIHQDPSGGLAG